MVILLKLVFLYMDITLWLNADNKNQHCFLGVESLLKTRIDAVFRPYFGWYLFPIIPSELSSSSIRFHAPCVWY